MLLWAEEAFGRKGLRIGVRLRVPEELPTQDNGQRSHSRNYGLRQEDVPVVRYDDRTLWYEVTVMHVVLARDMWKPCRPHEERKLIRMNTRGCLKYELTQGTQCVTAHDFQAKRLAVRQTLTIGECGEAVASDDSIDLGLCDFLLFCMDCDAEEEGFDGCHSLWTSPSTGPG